MYAIINDKLMLDDNDGLAFILLCDFSFQLNIFLLVFDGIYVFIYCL